MNFAEKLKKLRKEQGMNQEELAEKASMTQASVSRYELGKTEPKLVDAHKLAKALGVTCADLVDDEEPKKKTKKPKK